MLRKLLFAALAAGTLAACTKNSPTGTTDTTKKPPADTVAVANWGLVQNDTNIFYNGKQVAKITSQYMKAASGIAASRYYPGMFWIENDQGDPNVAVYLVDSAGAMRADIQVVGATNRDWTDMTIGPGPSPDTTYIYVADIGDSPGDHPFSTIYRFSEPNIPLDSGILYRNSTTATKITYAYPDGPRDAETILLDPVSKDIYIVDKGINGTVYELPYPQSTDTVILATKLVENLHFGPWRCGAIGSHRRDIILKGYQNIYYWPISPGESILNVLITQPVSIPNTLNEVQGEAMCLTPNDSEIWTTSKFSTLTYADLGRYLRK